MNSEDPLTKLASLRDFRGLAKLYLATHTLRHWKSLWFRWTGHRYLRVSRAELAVELTNFINEKFDQLRSPLALCANIGETPA